jgi:hypothetical protein
MDMETDMTKKPNTLIIDALTGEQTVREMTDLEFQQYEIDLVNGQTKNDQAEEKIQAKTALLEKLGISEDEARLLLI